jgi:hypothetical protein
VTAVLTAAVTQLGSLHCSSAILQRGGRCDSDVLCDPRVVLVVGRGADGSRKLLPRGRGRRQDAGPLRRAHEGRADLLLSLMMLPVHIPQLRPRAAATLPDAPYALLHARGRPVSLPCLNDLHGQAHAEAITYHSGHRPPGPCRNVSSINMKNVWSALPRSLLTLHMT